MGLITKEVEIEISNYNYKHYDKIPKISDNKRTKKKLEVIIGYILKILKK